MTSVFPRWQLCPVMSLERKMSWMPDASWMFSDCTGGTSVLLKSRLVRDAFCICVFIFQYIERCSILWIYLHSNTNSLCWFPPSQDAHELFHVLTSSLEEERDHQPKVTHLFDMQSLEASYHLHTAHKYLLHWWPQYALKGSFNPSSSSLSFSRVKHVRFALTATLRVCLSHQSLPDQVEKTMTCRSRGKDKRNYVA